MPLNPYSAVQSFYLGLTKQINQGNALSFCSCNSFFLESSSKCLLAGITVRQILLFPFYREEMLLGRECESRFLCTRMSLGYDEPFSPRERNWEWCHLQAWGLEIRPPSPASQPCADLMQITQKHQKWLVKDGRTTGWKDTLSLNHFLGKHYHSQGYLFSSLVEKNLKFVLL